MMSEHDVPFALLLVGAHLCLYTYAGLSTRKPVITLFHLALIYQIFAFVIRPLFSVAADGFTLYSFQGGWKSYEQGMEIQLTYMLFYVATYLYLERTLRAAGSNVAQTLTVQNPLRALLWSTVLGGTAVALIILLSGRAWLPTEREQTLTSVVPFGKFLFPMAVISLSAVLPLMYCTWRQYRSGLVRSIAIVSVITSTVLIALLHQRGFLILGLLAALLLWEKGMDKMPLGKLFLFGLLAVAWLWTVRPLVNSLLGGQEQDIVAEATDTVAESILSRATFDNADVWPVVLDYVNDRGHQPTLLVFPARFFTPHLRDELGVKTAVDRVNEYYWGGDLYWTSNWGFNVTLPQELFINLGPFAFPLVILAAMLTWKVDRWLQHGKVVGPAFVFVATGLFFSGGFLGDPSATLQWLVGYGVLGIGVQLLARLRL